MRGELTVGEAAARFVKARRAADNGKQRKQPPQERRALDLLRKEADKYGAELENDGEGGLPSSLVLKVMRRDKYRCKVCGDKKRKNPITVHHLGGIVESDWLDAKGHTNDPNNIVTICTKCHDRIHEKARKEGVDSSQIVASADKGNPKYDPKAR